MLTINLLEYTLLPYTPNTSFTHSRKPLLQTIPSTNIHISLLWNFSAGQMMFNIYFQILGQHQMAWQWAPNLRVEKDRGRGEEEEGEGIKIRALALRLFFFFCRRRICLITLKPIELGRGDHTELTDNALRKKCTVVLRAQCRWGTHDQLFHNMLLLFSIFWILSIHFHWGLREFVHTSFSE